MILAHRKGRKMSTDAEDIIALCLLFRDIYIYCLLARQTISSHSLVTESFGTRPPDFDLCEPICMPCLDEQLQLQLKCERPAQNSRHFTTWGDLHKTKQCDPVPGKILGIVGQDPTDSKSNWLLVDMFQFCFHSFEIYSIDSSKMMGNPPEVSNLNRLFLKLNRFICN